MTDSFKPSCQLIWFSSWWREFTANSLYFNLSVLYVVGWSHLNLRGNISWLGWRVRPDANACLLEKFKSATNLSQNELRNRTYRAMLDSCMRNYSAINLQFFFSDKAFQFFDQTESKWITALELLADVGFWLQKFFNLFGLVGRTIDINNLSKGRTITFKIKCFIPFLYLFLSIEFPKN